MRRYIKTAPAMALAVSLLPCMAGATLITYDTKALFLSETGAIDATGNYSNLGNIYSGPATSITFGSVTFTPGPDTNQLWFGTSGLPYSDWTSLLLGNDIAIGGPENLNADFSSSVYSMGFDFVEPTSINVNATFRESLFTLSLFQGSAMVDSFGFSRTNNNAAFVGVWSDTAFDRVEIREVYPAGNHLLWAENEFFGHFYSGTQDMPESVSVPEPGTLPLLLTVGVVWAVFGRRRLVSDKRRP